MGIVSILQVDKVGDGLHNNRKVFKTTELYAWKWLGRSILCYVYFFHNLKEKKKQFKNIF